MDAGARASILRDGPLRKSAVADLRILMPISGKPEIGAGLLRMRAENVDGRAKTLYCRRRSSSKRGGGRHERGAAESRIQTRTDGAGAARRRRRQGAGRLRRR